MYKQDHRVHFDGASYTYKLTILWFIVFQISTSPSRSGHVKTFIYVKLFGCHFLGIKLDSAFPNSDNIRHVYLCGNQIK